MSKPQVLKVTSFTAPSDASVVLDRSMFSRNKDFLTALAITSHGHTSSFGHTAEYRAWTNMKTRCFNRKYYLHHRYGGRGITVCDRWLTFANFLADMGRKPNSKSQLDRINNDGNYEPGNCRWVDTVVQNHNRSNSRSLEVDGVIKTLKEWSVISGIRWKTIWRRLRDGWTPKDAVFMSAKDGTTTYRKRIDAPRPRLICVSCQKEFLGSNGSGGNKTKRCEKCRLVYVNKRDADARRRLRLKRGLVVANRPYKPYKEQNPGQ
jgi:hypothetical protein